MKRVLVTDYVHPVLITGLREHGYVVQYAPDIERSQVLDWLMDCSGIVINTKIVADEQLMQAAPHLEWIARLGSGLDIIDLEKARHRDIAVISTPQANANAVAEHVFGMLLGLLRNIPRADREVRNRIWNRERNRGIELENKTIGIIGFGNNGSAFARKFAGWDVRVIAYDKYKTGYADDLPFVTETTLEQVMASADILSVHLPLTKETFHLINTEFLNKCKAGVILVNSSRGKIVDTIALLDVLETGQVSGACLDVFENEKPGTYSDEETLVYRKLFERENVILTPHIAGWTHESKKKIANQILDQVGHFTGLR